ncbi:MAG: LCP family protein [Actinomycetia bacterium]|nr:LCP family protein [Actinomycetes bacterium]
MGTGGKIRRTWPQRLLLGFNLVLVAACLAAAGGLYTFSETLASVETVLIDNPTAATVAVDEPRNILIVGTDSAANLDEDDPVTNGRKGERLADVIMVMRIDPSKGTARLLSFPRDTRATLAPGGGSGRINAAIAGVDGARDLIDTIRRNFGISIDNYVEVDFAGFKDLVEQLGGVPVYFAAPVRDKQTGLFVEEPGCVVLDPDQALAYARARHFQYEDSDGKWRFDQTGDLGRITRQQDFIKRAMQKASEIGVRNPGTAIGIVNAAKDSVVMDQTLSVGTILELVDVFRTFNPEELDTHQVPTYAAPRGGVAYQDVDWDEALPLLLAYWGYDTEGQLTPEDILVDVEGPRSRSEAVDLVVQGLDEIGFDASSDIVRRGSSDTTITYGPAGFEAALTLATWLEDTPEMDYDEDIVGPRLELSVPDDFGGLRAEPMTVDQLPFEVTQKPKALRTTTTTEPDEQEESGSGDDSGDDQGDGTTDGESDPDSDGDPGDDSTTTSIQVDEDPAFIQAAEEDGAPPGIVPTDPEKAAACR